MNYNTDQSLIIIFLPLLAVVGFFLLIFVVLLIIRYFLQKKNYLDHVVFLIKLPKDQPTTAEEANVQYYRGEIAKAETMFSAVGGLKAQRGIKAWLYGRDDVFSFEIVAHQKTIAFYVTAPRGSHDFLQEQIHAYYPEALIEEVKDYNLFLPQSVIYAGLIRTKASMVLPIRTYLKNDNDSLNGLINALSKLTESEGAAIQITVRSAKKSWHRQANDVVKRAYELVSVKKALHGQPLIFKIINQLSTPKKDPLKEQQKMHQPIKQLSAMELETLKNIEEKNAKAGLDVNIRLIVSAKNLMLAKSYLANIAASFSQYNYFDYGNGFTGTAFDRDQQRIIQDFIYRRFDQRRGFILNTEELASIYHFPLANAETPNILWLGSKGAAAPVNLPTEGVILGYNDYRDVRREVRIKRDDRRRHTYLVGKSGTGKSALLANLAIQDIHNGEGVAVLDPNGDLIEDILARVPAERAEDVIYFSPADTARPLALNLLEFDPRYPEQKTFVINEMIGIFDKLYDLRATGGPIFEQYMRNAMLLVMSDPASGSTLMEIPRVLADAEFRNLKLSRCQDYTVVDFWRKEAEKAGGDAALANVVPYITSKLTAFISNDMMRPIIGQQISSFNFRDIMDKGKILLVSLPKGVVGEANAHLLGMIIVGKILMAALSRTDVAPEARKDFYLYLDEFQNFTTDSIAQILAEARKYCLNLIIAHQYIGQLAPKNNTTVRDAVFGNVGTMAAFKVGAEDAEFLKKDFAPTFNEFDLINVPAATALLKLLIDNTVSKPFTIKTPWPLFGQIQPGLAETIKATSRLRYGRDRQMIEEEILQRSKVSK